MATGKSLSLRKGGALANIDRPSRLFFQNKKPGWHETVGLKEKSITDVA
jgi:hypothetical protein